VTEPAAGSTVPRRTLGIVLRQARNRAGKDLAQAADAVGQSQQSVRRIEQGTVSTPTGKVANLCDLYGVPTPTREALIALAKETKSAATRWWHSYGAVVPAWFEVYLALEQTAKGERCFDPLLVNGLCQDAEYMEAAIRAVEPELTVEDVAARAELRRSRQQLLTRSFPAPLRLDAIIAESVLLPELPEGVMRAQIWHLLKATELPHVQVRVLPLSAGLHRASVTGAFTLLDFPAEAGNTAPSTVYSESQTGAIYLDTPSEVETFEGVWAALEAAALDPAQSIELMSHRMKELNDRES
jgi:transcriptional regulator with XRE-family HTH domain